MTNTVVEKEQVFPGTIEYKQYYSWSPLVDCARVATQRRPTRTAKERAYLVFAAPFTTNASTAFTNYICPAVLKRHRSFMIDPSLRQPLRRSARRGLKCNAVNAFKLASRYSPCLIACVALASKVSAIRSRAPRRACLRLLAVAACARGKRNKRN